MRNIQSKKFYITFVLLPSILICGILFNIFIQGHHNAIRTTAKRQTVMYTSGILTYLLELKTSVETTAGVVSSHWNEPKLLQTFLETSYIQNHNLVGFYIVDSNGKLAYSSNPDVDSFNVSNENYYKEMLKLKDTVITGVRKSLVDKSEINVVASPIMPDGKNIEGALLATIRLNETVPKLLKIDKADPYVVITNGDENVIFGNSEILKMDSKYLLKQKLPSSDWKVVYQLMPIPKKKVIEYFIISFISVFSIIHLIYLILLYIKTMKKSKYEEQRHKARKLEMIGEFAASTAHEIRNPLTGIQGLISLLQEKHLDETDQFYYSVIKDELKRINEISSQFLILGKPLALEKKHFKLKALINQSLPLIQSEANMKGVAIQLNLLEEDISFYGCSDHISQILLNLCKNAIDASAKGKSIYIALNKTNEHMVQLTVRDEGIGIPNKELENIFKPFYSTKDEGTGLGLVVCKKITESYNGTIHITSELEKGTEVQISLPLES